GRIIRRAVGERRGGADVGLQAVGEEEANAAAGRSQRKAIAQAVAVIPGHPAVDESVELVTAQILKVRLLVEAQFSRARQTIVAADLGAAIAAPERDAAEIELLRGEQRAGRHL